MSETVLINISGRDRPGLVSEIFAVLSSFGTCVLDIGQAVVLDALSLGILIELPRAENLHSLEEALTMRSKELGLQVNFTPIAKHDLNDWITPQAKEQFIITVLGRAVSAHDLARVSAIVNQHGLNVDRVERLSGRVSLAVHTPDANACVQLTVSGNGSSEQAMRAAFLAAAHDLKI